MREEKIIKLKAEMFDLGRERRRVMASLARLNEVIEKKAVELEELEKEEIPN